MRDRCCDRSFSFSFHTHRSSFVVKRVHSTILFCFSRTDKEIMLKEMLFGLTIQTTIPYPFIKVCRRRATAKSTARLVLFSSAGGEKTFLSKKKVDLAFQDSHVTKRFVSVVLGTIGKERGEREEEEVEKEKEKEKEEEKEDPEPLLSARGSRRKPGRPKSPRRRRGIF